MTAATVEEAEAALRQLRFRWMVGRLELEELELIETLKQRWPALDFDVPETVVQVGGMGLGRTVPDDQLLRMMKWGRV